MEHQRMAGLIPAPYPRPPHAEFCRGSQGLVGRSTLATVERQLIRVEPEEIHRPGRFVKASIQST